MSFSSKEVERSFADRDLQAEAWADLSESERREAHRHLASHRERFGNHWKLVWASTITREEGHASWVFYDPFEGSVRDSEFGITAIG